MDDFMERVTIPREEDLTRERNLRRTSLADRITSYANETELYYNDLEKRLLSEDWPSGIVHDAIKHYLITDERYVMYLRQCIRNEAYDLDKLENEFESSKSRITDAEFKEKMREHIDKLRREDALKEEAHRYEAERQRKLAMEEASKMDYTSLIDQYLIENKNTRCVSARELGDRIMHKLTAEQRENLYFNQPLFAAYKSIGTSMFDEVFKESIQAYQKSLVIQKIINSYLDKVSPERDRDDYEIDKLIEMLPDERKASDDRTYKAYTAICWLHDAEAQRQALEEFTVTDFEDEKIKKEFTAQTWSDVMHGEPYSVAYRNAFEKAIGSVSKQCGKIKAFPTHIADVASQALSLGEKETLGQNLHNKIQQDKEIERIVQEKNRERDELRAELAAEKAKQDKLLNQTATERHAQQQANFQYRYGYNNQQPQQNNNIPVKYIGIGINAAILIVCLLFEKLTGTSTFLLWVGLGLATYGWIVKPEWLTNTPDYKYRTTKSLAPPKGESKWLWFVVGGYAMFLVCFLTMATL